MVRALAILLCLIVTPVTASDAFWTQAMGVAPVSSAAQVTAARRSALAEALIVAAMAGGADIRGHTVMDKARIQADRMVMRPNGRVHRYEVIEDRQNGSYWQITIKALVGPDQGGACQDQQRFVVNAYRPQVRVDPSAPAWAGQLGGEIANMVLDTVETHPNFDLVQMLADTDKKQMSAERRGFDYTALTRGTRVSAKTDHSLSIDIHLTSRGNGLGGSDLWAVIDIALYSPARPAARQSVAAKFPYKYVAGFDRITGAKRNAAHDYLRRATYTSVQQALSGFACQAPTATLRRAGGDYHVDLGVRHGLTAGALGFISDFSKSLQPFEIVSLNQNSAVVRPIGAVANAARYDGAQVTFLKARLP